MKLDPLYIKGKDVLKSTHIKPKQYSLLGHTKNTYNLALEGFKARELRNIKEAIRQRDALAGDVKTIKAREYKSLEAISYFATNFAPNLATMNRILQTIHDVRADWRPKSVLDFGCGAGIASIAIAEKFGDEQMEILGVDSSMQQLDLAKKVTASLQTSLLSKCKVKWSPVIVPPQAGFDGMQRFDVVVALKSLAESLDTRPNALEVRLRQLWSHTGDTLILCEPGTRTGFEIIAKARQLLLKIAQEEKDLASLAEMHRAQEFADSVQIQNNTATLNNLTVSLDRLEKIGKNKDWIDLVKTGAGTVAPCPHDKPCPLLVPMEQLKIKPQFCRFYVRTEAPETARNISKTKLGTQDDYFSYVVISRSFVHSREKQHARIIMTPLKKKGHFYLDYCSPSGKLERAIVTRQRDSSDSIGKVASYGARKASWGDRWPLSFFQENDCMTIRSTIRDFENFKEKVDKVTVKDKPTAAANKKRSKLSLFGR